MIVCNSHAKVGYRQAILKPEDPRSSGFLFFVEPDVPNWPASCRLTRGASIPSVTKGYAETLAVIAARSERRAVRASLVLDTLFRRLAASRFITEADAAEEAIWTVWMHHPHRSAAETIELATSDIAARRYDIAETRLTLLTRRSPDFSEAWHKRATLYYLLGEDGACVRDLHRALVLEPRHFAAILHFAEILLGADRKADARFAFAAALSLHPHLSRARQALSEP